MSTNCVRCITNKRTGSDLLCNVCRGEEYKDCRYYEPEISAFESCPLTISGTEALTERCKMCPCYIFSIEKTAGVLAKAPRQAALRWEQKNRKELQK